MNLNTVLLASAFALVTGCAVSENQTIENQTVENKTAENPVTLTPTKVDSTTKQATVSGVIGAIQNGKDGYTAQLTTPEGLEFYVTISRANLKDPRTYRTVTTGDLLSASGDFWELEGKSQVTVREIL